jgi:hypothetical protein
MNLWKKLQNPFALVGQGFVLGGLIFFATHGGSLQASGAAGVPSGSLLPSAGAGR